ncbi:hypothetical protein IE53DRAFT_370316 [Violaceomyces palustris]|uniref:Uncharacterized protein n=1 Tax=Violaceomyces palustris TaxID=1673888 RepID=A0ACD0NSP7_9BASI|nr:hypothetical protein IE53DRAFT_370316 [Violaceomyces palustris]
MEPSLESVFFKVEPLDQDKPYILPSLQTVLKPFEISAPVGIPLDPTQRLDDDNLQRRFLIPRLPPSESLETSSKTNDSSRDLVLEGFFDRFQALSAQGLSQQGLPGLPAFPTSLAHHDSPVSSSEIENEPSSDEYESEKDEGLDLFQGRSMLTWTRSTSEGDPVSLLSDVGYLEISGINQDSRLFEAFLESSLEQKPTGPSEDGDKRFRPAPVYPVKKAIESLRITAATGSSSSLFHWDPSSARFDWGSTMMMRRLKREQVKQAKAKALQQQKKRKGKAKEMRPSDSLLQNLESWWGKERVEGFTLSTSDSVIQRFLLVGTMLRRIDERISEIRQAESAVREAHAFAFALESVMTWLKEELALWAGNDLLGSEAQGVEGEKCTNVGSEEILNAWAGLEHVAEIVESLGELLHCKYTRLPPFKPLPFIRTSSIILSHLHSNLVAALESHTPPLVRAILAFLLEQTSRNWRDDVLRWVAWPGYESERTGELGFESSSGVAPSGGLRHSKRATPWSGAEIEWALDERGEEDVGYTLRPSGVPSFISLSTARDLLEAGRALRLLKKAVPQDHPLVRKCSVSRIPTPGDQESKHLPVPVPTWIWDDTEADMIQAAVRREVSLMRKEIAVWRRKGGPHGTQSASSDICMLSAGVQFVEDELRPRMASGRLDSITEFENVVTLDSKSPSTQGLPSTVDRFSDMLKLFDSTPLLSPTVPVPPSFGSMEDDRGARSEAKEVQTLVMDTKRDSLVEFLADYLSADQKYAKKGSVPQCRTSAILPSFDLISKRSLVDPLLHWSRLINSALISVFFRDLGLGTYLDTCRQFLLLGSDFFSTRIIASLFEDGRDGSLSFASVRRERKGDIKENDLGIALSRKLTSDGSWPPNDAVLSSSLNSAVLETVSAMRAEHEQRVLLHGKRGSGASGLALRDLDERLSFAVVEPPISQEKRRLEGWQDPHSIEALDWLTLSFHPPPLISPLLTQMAQSKYQRLWNLLLRISRVKVALVFIFTYTFKSSRHGARRSARKDHDSDELRPPIFSDPLNAGYQLLYRFRLDAQHFLNAYASYVIDIGIEEKWLRFQRRLKQLRRDAEGRDDEAFGRQSKMGATSDFEGIDAGILDGAEDVSTNGGEGGGGGGTFELKDVFSLARYHENILDKMLETCFLKQRQRSINKVINSLLQIILDFARAIHDLGRGLVSEALASSTMKTLHKRFQSRLSILLRGLQLVRERGGGVKRIQQQQQQQLESLEAATGRAIKTAEGVEGLGRAQSRSGRDGAAISAADAEMQRQEAEAEADLRMLEDDHRETLTGSEAQSIEIFMTRLDLLGRSSAW